MADLISRQATIDAINQICPIDTEYDCTLLDKVDVRCVLTDLPSAQPEQRWIPCSERLPNKFGEMLVTFVPAAGTLWTRVIIAHYNDLMGIAKPCFWIGNVGKNDFANITSQVVAWMPLPEPYREVEE